MCEYKKQRSRFWLKIFENEDSTNLSTNGMVKSLIELVSPQIVECSPTGWKLSKNHQDNYNLWIPDDCMNWDCLDAIKAWAEQANRHIWLGTNRNTVDYFYGNEVDYCMAADWNFDIETQGRTEVGNAEYQLKYQIPKGLVSKENAGEFANILASAILDCTDCLPFDLSSFIVTTIPAVKAKQNKLSWQLARYVASKVDAPFMEATLTKDKPQMKEQSVEDKIRIWREIFHDETTLCLSHKVRGHDIFIVDDLYQSGASIWCFAEFLKDECGARTVIAATSVKALKDGDNT
ncbi:hypothetical protein OBV_30600 [Oscillibacter valericigenes Sjm18-20]|nr:hypothetical protein OBV_30600 [Oscillibacter valericigenes Sjm18-20]